MSQGKKRDQKEVIEVLEPFFRLGYSVNKSCKLAKIPQSTVQTWIGEDDSLRLKINGWQGEIGSIARRVVAEGINSGNKDDAKWWLERREKAAFSTRAEQTGAGGKDLIPSDKDSLKANTALTSYLNGGGEKDTAGGDAS
jgi:hypothetical protein